MGSLVFGMSFDALTGDAHRHIFEHIRQSNVRVSVLMQALELRFARLDKKLFPKSIKARNSFLKFIEELLRERKNISSTVCGDVFSLLQAFKDPETGSGISSDQIASETATLVIAGKLFGS
jgi:cytochrome P450